MKKVLIPSLILGAVGLASAVITPGWKHVNGGYIASVVQNVDTLRFTMKDPEAGQQYATYGILRTASNFNAMASIVLSAKSSGQRISFYVVKKPSPSTEAKFLCEDGEGYCAAEVNAITIMP